MPTISEIPQASTLHTQLDNLNKAIAALNTGSGVTNLTTGAPAPPPEEPALWVMPITVILDPPITDSQTIATLITALQVQADAVTAQLVAAGYEDA